MNIPYCEGYTSVFALENDGEWILVDFAASDDDGKRYIIPAIEEMCFIPRIMLCTHMHEDHSGGIKILADKFKTAEIAAFSRNLNLDGANVHYLTDGEVFSGRYKILNLPGHTDDSAAVLDMKNNILLSSDCLQGKGIATYGANIDNAEAYLNTIKKISELELNGIIASHEYEPFGSAIFGKNNVKEYIGVCTDVIKEIISVAAENINASPEEIAAIYNSDKSRLPIGAWTVEGALGYLKK